MNDTSIELQRERTIKHLTGGMGDLQGARFVFSGEVLPLDRLASTDITSLRNATGTQLEAVKHGVDGRAPAQLNKFAVFSTSTNPGEPHPTAEPNQAETYSSQAVSASHRDHCGAPLAYASHRQVSEALLEAWRENAALKQNVRRWKIGAVLSFTCCCLLACAWLHLLFGGL